MNENIRNDHRRYKRHGAKGRLEYNFSYDVTTKMEFQIENENKIPDRAHTFSGLSKNLSVEGLCFVSDKQLKKGTPLHLLLHLPESNEIVSMEGEVKWSEVTFAEEEDEVIIDKPLFDTGIKLSEVNGNPVHETIHYDELFNLQWSVVLESVFGRFRLIMDEKKKVDQ